MYDPCALRTSARHHALVPQKQFEATLTPRPHQSPFPNEEIAAASGGTTDDWRKPGWPGWSSEGKLVVGGEISQKNMMDSFKKRGNLKLFFVKAFDDTRFFHHCTPLFEGIKCGIQLLRDIATSKDPAPCR